MISVIRWLFHSRVDLAPMDLVGGQHLIQTIFPNEAERFTYIPKNIDIQHDGLFSHLLISRKFPRSKQLTQRFNQALHAIKRKKIYQRIMLKNKLLLTKPAD